MLLGFYGKVYRGIKKEDAFHIWTNISKWTDWHENMAYCEMKGNPSIGKPFIWVPKIGKPHKATFVAIEKNHQFTSCTELLGAEFYSTCSVTETSEGLLLANRMVLEGPLKRLWAKTLEKNVADFIPRKIDALVRNAMGAPYRVVPWLSGRR